MLTESTVALSTGVPGTEPELGSRHGSQQALLDFLLRRSNKIGQEPRATRMSLHGCEAGRSRELWQEVLPGLLAFFQVLCGCWHSALLTCLSPEWDMWLNVTVQFLLPALGNVYKVQVY